MIYNLLNSLWYRDIQALNVSRRDSGPCRISSLKSVFDFTAKSEIGDFFWYRNTHFRLYLDLRTEQVNFDSLYDIWPHILVSIWWTDALSSLKIYPFRGTSLARTGNLFSSRFSLYISFDWHHSSHTLPTDAPSY